MDFSRQAHMGIPTERRHGILVVEDLLDESLGLVVLDLVVFELMGRPLHALGNVVDELESVSLHVVLDRFGSAVEGLLAPIPLLVHGDEKAKDLIELAHQIVGLFTLTGLVEITNFLAMLLGELGTLLNGINELLHELDTILIEVSGATGPGRSRQIDVILGGIAHLAGLCAVHVEIGIEFHFLGFLVDVVLEDTLLGDLKGLVMVNILNQETLERDFTHFGSPFAPFTFAR